MKNNEILNIEVNIDSGLCTNISSGKSIFTDFPFCYDSEISNFAYNYLSKDNINSFLENFSIESIRKLSKYSASSKIIDFVMADGRYVEAHIFVTPKSENNKAYIIIYDISESLYEIHNNKLIEKYALALKDTYDELFEINVTYGTYRILYHTPNKYVIPPKSGLCDSMIAETAQSMVHPHEKDMFKEFFNIDRLVERFKKGYKKDEIEFRKKLVAGGYGWVRVTILPVRNEEILICYILDINTEKNIEDEHLTLQKIYNSIVKNEYRIVNLIDIEKNSYKTYMESKTPYELPECGNYNDMIIKASEYIHEQDRKMFINNMTIEGQKKRLEKNSQYNSIFYRIYTDGYYRWTSNRSSYFGPEKNIILSTSIDVNESKEAEEKTRLISEKFIKSFGSIYINIYEYSAKSGKISIIKGNESFDNNIELDYENLVDREIKKYVCEEDIDILKNEFSLKSINSFLESGQKLKSVDVRRISKNKPLKWIEVSAFSISEQRGKPSKVLITTRDISSEKFFQEIVDRFVYDNCDYFMYIDANNGAYSIFSANSDSSPMPPSSNYSYKKWLDEYLRYYIAESDVERVVKDMRLNKVIKELNKNGEYIIYFGIIDSKKGYSYKKLRYVYYDKSSKMIILTRTDVTHMHNEEKRKNELLLNALKAAEDANNAKTDFLSRISHDIRTPMNAIVGMTAIAYAKINDTQRVKDCLNKITVSSQYLLSLINDVLDMSRIESGKMLISNNRFDFVDLIQNIMTLMCPQAESKDIFFRILIQEPIDNCYVGDALRINQILINIIGNSLKYTPKDGEISVFIHETKRSNKSAVMEFLVKDTGRGMSESFMKKIFEPFEQENPGAGRNQEGTGLGLTIVKKLTELMNGTIDIKSKLKEGTEVKISIPLKRDSRQRKTSIDNIIDKSYSNLKVLIIDSDKTTCQNNSKLFSNMGVSICWSLTGKEAINKIKSSADKNINYDIILIDHKISDMSSIEIVKNINKICSKKAFVVMTTSYSWIEVEDAARDAGVDLFLTKPLFSHNISKIFSCLNSDTKYNLTSEQSLSNKKMFKKEKILIVEDNEINMEIAKTLLELQNISVDFAYNGKEALEKFEKSKEGHYKAIFMDIRMPVMNGLDATEAIRALKRDDALKIPIIAMSANAFQEDIDIALEKGLNDYIVKPFEIENLYYILEKYIL